LIEILKRGNYDVVSERAANNPNCPPEAKIKWMQATGKIEKEDESKGHIIEYEKTNQEDDLSDLKKLISKNNNWYKKAQELYRGDTNPVNIDDYDPEYARKQGKELGSSMRGGPGIYFTTKEEDAKTYGNNVTKKILNNANILTEQSPLFNRKQIEKILQGVDKEIMKSATSNWSENYSVGKKLLIESIMNAENPIEQLMAIWSAVFYHQNSNSFIELMIKNNIDGIYYKRIESKHYVIYNKKVLI